MSYTKHQATIRSRLQMLKDPANEVTYALDAAEDVRGSCRQSWLQPASSCSRLDGLTSCTRTPAAS